MIPRLYDARQKGLILSLPTIIFFIVITNKHYDEANSKTTNKNTRRQEMDQPNGSQEFNSSKKILYFNNFFHIKDWNFGFGLKPFSSCPVSNCYVTKLVDFCHIGNDIFQLSCLDPGREAYCHPLLISTPFSFMEETWTSQSSRSLLNVLKTEKPSWIPERSFKVPNQKRRRREQLYVFFILESPLNDGLNYSNPRFIM